MTDVELARRMASGDEQAFAEWFDDCFPRLYRFAFARLGGDAGLAEELVQMTMIRAVRKIDTYRGEAALFTWLCTICRREIDAWRARVGRRAEVGLPEDDPDRRAALDSLAALTDSPERQASRQELARLVQVALDHLPGRYGRALEWRYIEGLSVTEVAERLGVGYKAAESILSRAREAFRDGFTALAGSWPDNLERPLTAEEP